MVARVEVTHRLSGHSPIVGDVDEENELRRKLGARLLTERIQGKNWNELKAARAAGIEPKTVRRIERGMNYEIASLEKYAAALGRFIPDKKSIPPASILWTAITF